MSECCNSQGETERAPLHLAVIGGGSAAFSAALKANGLGARVTIVNDRLPIGGTCVNVGCVPSKTLIRAAEAVHRARHPGFDGIEATGRVSDFQAVIGQKRELVEGLRRAKYADVVARLENVRIVEGRARLAEGPAIEVAGERIAADRILIATGASPDLPPIPGLAESGYLTNETAFDLEELPETLIVLGGRYVALECAQMFSRFGCRVTLLQRSARILPTESPDVTDALTACLIREGIEIHTGVAVARVERGPAGVRVEAEIRGEKRMFEASHLLAATGRRPNTEGLGLERLGIGLDARGFLEVDGTLRTADAAVYGAGDVIGGPMFVYTAAYEGALAAENALTGTAIVRDYAALPWVVFTDPQVAGVGLDEAGAKDAGIQADAAVLPLTHLPRALAARDTRGFIRLIRDAGTDRLIGARIVAAEGAELLMEAALAIRHGITVRELAASFHPYLTLSEGIKLAAIAFEKDVESLSCCAT